MKEEGIIRDLARQIQGMRKDAGLAPKDSVVVYFKIDDKYLEAIVLKRQKNLAKEVGAKNIQFVGAVKDGMLIDRHLKLENKPIWIGINKVLISNLKSQN